MTSGIRPSGASGREMHPLDKLFSGLRLQSLKWLRWDNELRSTFASQMMTAYDQLPHYLVVPEMPRLREYREIEKRFALTWRCEFSAALSERNESRTKDPPNFLVTTSINTRDLVSYWYLSTRVVKQTLN